MKYFTIEPETPGGLGDRTIMDRRSHPPVVMRLEFVFDGWLGDELLESFPCFVATNAVADILRSVCATGVEFGEVETSTSDTFEELYPNRELPNFTWLKITGRAGKDDFGLSSEHRMVVSDRILTALKSRQLRYCTISQY